VPQDFHNVAATDPLGHAARFFYGPMLQVRPALQLPDASEPADTEV
jgi:hypothetical protein